MVFPEDANAPKVKSIRKPDGWWRKETRGPSIKATGKKKEGSGATGK